MRQEQKLEDELQQLKAELGEQDVHIDNRRNEIATLDSLIAQSREGFINYKSQRDKLQDERKYVIIISFLDTRTHTIDSEGHIHTFLES